MSQENLPILIIGAGIVGNTLAQSLRQRSIPFLIFERDASPEARGQGWGLSLTWALDSLLASLPEDIREDVFTCQVDQHAWDKDQYQILKFVNSLTLDVTRESPPFRRLRVQREKLRRLLMRDLDIIWNKKFKEYTITEDGVTAIFDDGTSYKGCLLVGADGSHSQVRRFVAVHPDINPLPVRMLGTTVPLTDEQAAPLQAIDSIYFAGSHPTNGSSFFCAVFEKREGDCGTSYVYQLCLSYPVPTNADNSPSTADDNSILLEEFRSLARSSLHPALREPFIMASPNSKIIPITIADWDTASWDGQDRVTLMGDAAHAMTMFRGEGANHGIRDALEFVEVLDKALRATPDRIIDKDLVRGVLHAYEGDMQTRAKEAVLQSRKACLDMHYCK